MTNAPVTPTIRLAKRSDLPALFDLAKRTLALDQFSIDLLDEKLFANRRPENEASRVYLAELAGRTVGMLQTVIREATAAAWLGLWCTDPQDERRGVAAALLCAAAAEWARCGIEQIRVLDLPGNYFTPGVDPRYTAAVCFLERHGFRRTGDCVNLIADLTVDFSTELDEAELRREGIEVRRARLGDEPLLDAFFATEFGPEWRFEAGLALANAPPTIHLALTEDRIIAFSAHSTQNREWGFFGPMGTIPEARGRGLGKVLLYRCLDDMRRAGHRTSVIPWVGPIPFYARHVPCRVDRVFWRYHANLADLALPADGETMDAS